tara:strand:- start:10203 stop:10784 length:582 start_codon:yes stop_codon:yes gene_type:complete
VPGEDLDIINFMKMIKYLKKGSVKNLHSEDAKSSHHPQMMKRGHINFEGQYSDPVHHPKFLEMLELCYKHKVGVSVQHASSAKPFNWYIKAFKINPLVKWKFSIDGLPKDSHKYRINQDGEKLFNVMKESTKYLRNKPSWQYIIFNYNENDIEEARSLANEIGVDFYTLQSSRWNEKCDLSYKPSEKYLLKNV